MQNIGKALELLKTKLTRNVSLPEEVEVLVSAEQELRELRERLKEIEFVESVDFKLCCPACKKEGDHKPDCWLSAAINQTKANE